jgi:hypothetical protein
MEILGSITHLAQLNLGRKHSSSSLAGTALLLGTSKHTNIDMVMGIMECAHHLALQLRIRHLLIVAHQHRAPVQHTRLPQLQSIFRKILIASLPSVSCLPSPPLYLSPGSHLKRHSQNVHLKSLSTP